MPKTAWKSRWFSTFGGRLSIVCRRSVNSPSWVFTCMGECAYFVEWVRNRGYSPGYLRMIMRSRVPKREGTEKRAESFRSTVKIGTARRSGVIAFPQNTPVVYIFHPCPPPSLLDQCTHSQKKIISKTEREELCDLARPPYSQKKGVDAVCVDESIIVSAFRTHFHVFCEAFKIK